MQFLNPLFLYGLLLTPVPVLLHLFYRRRRSRVDFSTVQFFRHRQRYFSHRRRLREILLLLLRTLALALLALALARPVLRRSAAGLRSRTAAVIVLDDTLSMDRQVPGGQRLFAVAKAKAEAVLGALHQDDSAGMVFVSGRPPIGITPRLQATVEQLRGLECTAAGGSFGSALTTAAGLLGAATAPNRELYLISDLQANQFPASRPPIQVPDGARLFVLPLTGSDATVAVSGVHLSTRPKIAGQVMRVVAEIANRGPAEQEVDVVLRVNGEERQRRQVVLAAGAGSSEAFDHVPENPGFLRGSIAVDDESLRLDNRRHFAVDVAANVRVLFLATDFYSRVQPFHFLRYAVDPPDGGHLNGFAVEEVYTSELTPASLRDVRIVALADPDPLDAATAGHLLRFLENGGTVISFAGSKVGPETFRALGIDPVNGLYGVKEEATETGLELAGPLAELNDLLALDLVQWRRWQVLEPPANARILARRAARPAIVDFPVGDGRWLATAFSVRRDYSNWPTLRSFPIAMIHLFDLAAREGRDHRRLTCGDQLLLSAVAEEVTVTYPDGRTEALPVDDGQAALTQTWQPGVLTLGGSRIRSVALQPAAAESELPVLSATAAADRLWSGPATTLAPDEPLPDQIRLHRRGSDLAGILLGLLLIALVLEYLIGNGYLLTGLKPRPRAVQQG